MEGGVSGAKHLGDGGFSARHGISARCQAGGIELCKDDFGHAARLRVRG